MSLYIVHLKEEPVLEVPCSVSDGTFKTELYAGHDFKEELTIGPEVLQPQDVTYSVKGKLVLISLYVGTNSSLSYNLIDYYYKLLLHNSLLPIEYILFV